MAQRRLSETDDEPGEQGVGPRRAVGVAGPQHLAPAGLQAEHEVDGPLDHRPQRLEEAPVPVAQPVVPHAGGRVGAHVGVGLVLLDPVGQLVAVPGAVGPLAGDQPVEGPLGLGPLAADAAGPWRPRCGSTGRRGRRGTRGSCPRAAARRRWRRRSRRGRRRRGRPREVRQPHRRAGAATRPRIRRDGPRPSPGPPRRRPGGSTAGGRRRPGSCPAPGAAPLGQAGDERAPRRCPRPAAGGRRAPPGGPPGRRRRRSAATSTGCAARGRGATLRAEAGSAQPGPQHGPGVDAHVAAGHGRGVVVASSSLQQIVSGSHAGTVTASVPPGRSTRASSARAARSSAMCSSTSAAMTRSKAPAANGRRRADACTTPRRRARRGPRRPPPWRPAWPGRRRRSGRVEVAGHGGGAPAEGLEGVAAGAGADVEQPVARLQAQPVVVDGQHGPVSRGAGPTGRRPGLGQQGPVVLDRAGGHDRPRPGLHHPAPAPGPDRGRAGRPGAQVAAQGGGQGLAVARAAPAGGVAVGPDHLGDGARRWWPPAARRSSGPRWPAARSPRRARAPRPARPRRRAR